MTLAPDNSPLSPRDDQVSVRVRFREDARIGPGKVALLEAVASTGSVADAGSSLNMSARRAWLLIDSLNKAFDVPVVVTDSVSDSANERTEAHLTDFGRALIEAYRAVEADTRKAVEERFSAIIEHLRT